MLTALSLLVVDRVMHASISGSKSPLYFLIRLLALDYTCTGVGLQAV